MTRRALILGCLWALFICCFTYYNNQILGQTFFISHHLPLAVFGVLLGLCLVNPIWARIHPGLALGSSELAVMATLALSVCVWPDVGGFRLFTSALSFPNHMYKLEAGWQGVGAMSYVPGGSPLLAEGFVVDFDGLEQRLTRSCAVTSQASARPSTDGSVANVHESLTEKLCKVLPAGFVRQLESSPSPLRGSERRRLLATLNELISGPSLLPLTSAPERRSPDLGSLLLEQQRSTERLERLVVKAAAPGAPPNEERLARYHAEYLAQRGKKLEQHINRQVLSLALPNLIAPPASGSGVILADGFDDPFAVGTLVNGWSGPRLSVWDLPWYIWWPTLRLWGSIAVLLVWAMLCLALIVHPQWTERELLPYPIIGFVRDLLRMSPARVPEVFYQKLFWCGLGAACALNLVNGLHAWLDWVPAIPKLIDLSPLRNLYPRLSQVGWSTFLVFQFSLYPLVIAFTYFIRGDVGLSLGISNIVWMLVGAALIGAGINLNDSAMGWGADQMVRIGGASAFACFILYTGRRYYLNVAAAALGFRRHAETPMYSVWAGRGLFLCSALMVWILQAWAGLHWIFSIVMLGGMLISVLVVARVNAEGGVFLFLPGHTPLSVIQAVFGLRAVAPSQYFTLSLLHSTFWSDPRATAMPFFTSGLHASQSVAQVSPKRTAPWLFGLVLLGFLVALVVTLSFQYNLGVAHRDTWAREGFSRFAFDSLTRQLSHLAEHGVLAGPLMSDWKRLSFIQPNVRMLAFIGAGFAAVTAFGALRLRMPRWPLHPVMVVGISSWAVNILAPSILLGWFFRTSVIQLGGTRGYRALRPLMTGIIAGELASGIAWIGVGLVYYAATGRLPAEFAIFQN